MEKILAWLLDLLTQMVLYILSNFHHNWLPIGLAIITAAVLPVYLKPEKLQEILLKRRHHVSIWGSVIFGVVTPFCACGTTAIVLGMLTTTLPWGPIMAFLAASPLMSPDGFILIAGFVSFEFAIALAMSAIFIGLGAGYLTHFIESTTNFLKNQTRFTGKAPASACGCGAPAQPPVSTCDCSTPAPAQPPATGCGCGTPTAAAAQTCCSNLQTAPPKNTGNNIFGFLAKIKWREIGKGVFNLGIKQILFFFTIFLGIGFLINHFVPTSWIKCIFGAKHFYAVPLAALLGLPIYITTESSLPLVKTLMSGGASYGAMLAFLLTGPGTSAPVIAGLATFMKKRALGLYVVMMVSGAIICGYSYDLFRLLIHFK